MTDTIFKRLPGVLSFQRGIVISDALFYDEIAGQFEAHPVPVIRHGIRGTQNINKTGDGETATSGEAKRQEVSNIQTTDSAKLAPEADALAVRFSLRFLNLKNALFACAPGAKDNDADITDLRQSIDSFIERIQTSDGVQEISRRYARNIANARWLWRNRLIAQQVTVTVNRDGTAPVAFNALSVPLHHFNDYKEGEMQIAETIAAGLCGNANATLEITARVEFGVRGAVEVFPSQNYLENKPRGFARSLYCLGEPERDDRTLGMRRMGHAALRDQKISNALRTIDTWYPDYATYGRPLAVEPNGASLEAQRFFRDKKTSAFDLIKRLNQLDATSNDGMFVAASLIRGGVFSEGGK